MGVEVSVALISSIGTLIGVVITVIWGNKKHSKELKENASVTIYRIEQLEKKVEKHNNLVERTYRLEEQNTLQAEQIKVANHRLDDLEKKNER